MEDVGNWIVLGVMTVVLVIAAITDVRTGKVYNRLTLSAMVLGLVLSGVRGAMTDGGAGALGMAGASAFAAGVALLGFGVLVLATGGLGFGDVKLMGAVGAISASWQCVLSTTVYAFVVALLLGLAVMIRHGIVKRTAQRLLSVLLTRASRAEIDLPDDSPKVPFAVAVLVGGVLAGVEVLLGVVTPWSANW